MKAYIDALARECAEEVDREDGLAARPAAAGFSLEGTYAIGHDRRVGVRRAGLRHAEEAARYYGATGGPYGQWREDDVRALRGEIVALRPFWGPGVTKEQAVAAYGRANPANA
jgi:hypothetical protein